MSVFKIVPILLFSLTIPLANYLISNVGVTCIPKGPCLVPVGFGLMAPSGVLVIGLALVLRDWVHETLGKWWAVAAVLLGTALSFGFSPAALAVASAVAFLFSEMSDLLVYSKLRLKSKPLAVLSSQVVGAVLDSMLFVYLAFGSLEFSSGNALGKIYAGAIVAFAMLIYKKRK